MEVVYAILELYGVTSVALGLLLSFFNWIWLAQSILTGRNISSVPLIGAFLLGAGALLVPTLRPYALLAILIDYGTLAFVLALPQIIRTESKTCSWNLLEEYVGRRGDTTARIRLFRHGHLVLYWAIKRPSGTSGITGMGRVGTWERDAESLVLRLGEDYATFESLSHGVKKGWLQTTGFRQHENQPDFALDSIEFVLKD